MAKAIELAATNPKLAEKFAGSLGAIKRSVYAIPEAVIDKLPQSAQDAIADIKNQLADFAVDESGAIKIPGVRRGPNDPIVDGLPYTQAQYDAYAARKRAQGLEPRTPEDYAAAREHWRKGGEAHSAAVDAEIDRLNELYPNAKIETTPSFRTSGENGAQRTSFPDIMVIGDDGSLKFVEVKTGGADLTEPQSLLKGDLENAYPTAATADQLRLDPDKTLGEQFPGGVTWEEARGPGYKD